MSNAALAWTNLFDSSTCTITASTASAGMPVSNLSVPHVQKKWRGTAGAQDYYLGTWTSNQSGDTFATMGLGSDISINAMTLRLRLSSADATGAAGDRYDSQTAGLSPTIDANYGYGIFLLPSVITGWKYARVDITMTPSPGVAYVEAGRPFGGTRTQLTYNFATGARRGWKDRSKITSSANGQTYVDRRSKHREWDVNFDPIDLTQRDSVFEAMSIACGTQTDVLFVSDPASTNLGRDSIWGLMTEVPQIIFPHAVDLFSASVNIAERR